MRKPQVFISHSTPLDDASRKAFLDAACEAIRNKGYAVLVDYQELKPGEWWRKRLNEWMAGCDAAVILLSRRAVTERPWWVQHEASVLTWRKALDASFRLVPALLDDVTLEELRKSEFSPLTLTEFQNFRPQAPQDIAEALGAPVPPARTPLEQWVGVLQEDILLGRRNKDDDKTLLTVAEAMGIPEPPQNPALPRAQGLAHEIAHRLACHGLPLFFEHLDELSRAFEPKAAIELLKAVAPAWISPAAAGELARLSGLSPPGSAVINGNEVPRFTSRLYIQRAFWPGKKWIVFQGKSPADQSLDPLIASILDDVRNHPKVRLRINQQPEDFLAETQLRVFIVLHVKLGATDLERLQARFPKAVFVLSGEAALKKADWAKYPRLHVLHPLVDPGVESEALRNYDDCMSALME